jgi:hypothetical protein
LGVDVVETDVGHKPTALNLADEYLADLFPRAYVDADVRLSVGALTACAEELRKGAFVTAPRLLVDTAGSSRVVRAYYRVWTRMPWVTSDLVGSGVYVLSAEAHRRVRPFPSDGADDLWVAAHFGPGERRTVHNHWFSVVASSGISQTIRRRARITAANTLIDTRVSTLPGPLPSEERAMVALVRRKPSAIGDVFVYLTAKVLARVWAERMIRRGSIAWHGDERTA